MVHGIKLSAASVIFINTDISGRAGDGVTNLAFETSDQRTRLGDTNAIGSTIKTWNALALLFGITGVSFTDKGFAGAAAALFT